MRTHFLGAAVVLVGAGALAAFQTPWREYPAIEHNSYPVPEDYAQSTDFVFARLMYPPASTARFDRAGRRWAQGNSSWTQDIRRLTGISCWLCGGCRSWMRAVSNRP